MPKPITSDFLIYGDNLLIYPSCSYATFKQAEKVKKKEGKQGELGI